MPINAYTTDPLFTSRFYILNKEADINVAVDLPDSSENLPLFLNSYKGKIFLNYVIDLIDQISKWAAEHKISDAAPACSKFKELYSTYDGKNFSVNNNYFMLYKSGIPHLAGILNLIQNDKIDLDVRIEVVKNLMTGIIVCAPGAYTHITDNFLKLASQLSISTEWMAARRTLAEQTVLDVLHETSDVPVEMEIHYVNAIVNTYTDMLKINSVDDDYIRICDTDLIFNLIPRIESELSKRINVEAIISHIIFELGMKLSEKLWATGGTDFLEKALNRYGTDKNYSIMNLITTDESGYKPVLFWYSEYELYRTLFTRLIQSQFIDISSYQMNHKLSNDVLISYLPGRSIKLAYVTSQQHAKSLVQYCIEQFNTQEPSLSRKQLLDFILSNKITDEQRFEIIQGIIKYINLDEDLKENKKSPASIKLWIDTISQLSVNNYKFDILLKELPKELQDAYIKHLTWDKISNLIHTGPQLINIFTVLPENQRLDFFTKHCKDRHLQLINSIELYRDFLRIAPLEKFDIVLRNFYAAKVSLEDYSRINNIQLQISAIILSRLPLSNWSGLSNISSMVVSNINNLNNLTIFLNELALDKVSDFLKLLNKEKLNTLLGYNSHFFTTYDWSSILKSLNELSSEKSALFLQKIAPGLKDCFVFKLVVLTQFLGELSIEKSKILLNALGKEFVTKSLWWCLSTDVKKLNKTKLTLVFDFLGTEELHNTNKSKYGIVTIINSSPPEIAELFLHYYHFKELKKVQTDKDYLLYFLLNVTQNNFNAILNQFNSSELLAIIRNNLFNIYSKLPSSKTSLFLSHFNQVENDELDQIFMSYIFKHKSVLLLNKITAEQYRHIIDKIGIKSISKYIKDRNELIFILESQSPDRQIELLQNYDEKQLKRLLLNENDMDKTLEFIRQYRNNPKLYDALLLATLKAYHEQYNERTHSLLNCFIPAKQIESKTFTVLEEAITKNIYEPNSGITFFKNTKGGKSRPEDIIEYHNNDPEIAKISREFLMK